MKKPLFIAISGKKGSGKDELARQLMARLAGDHQLGVAITHFADPLKEICIQLFGLDKTKIYGSNEDKETLTEVMWDGFPEGVREKYTLDRAGKDGSWDGERFYYKLRTGPMTHRELLQIMGSDIFRERVYQNLWAEYPFKQTWKIIEPISGINCPADVVLIADLRFSNEIEEALKNGGLVIRIKRNTRHVDNHLSETALDSYEWNKPRHIVIDNNGTLEDLKREAARIAADIGELLRGK